jgi:predicted nucleic acid-binding Zn ribbon protein
MTFMNRGTQNKRQRTAVIVIVGVVLLTFLVSIVALSIG